LLQLSTHLRLVGSTNAELLAALETLLIILNAWSADLALSCTAVSSCHTDFSVSWLQELNGGCCGLLRFLLLLWLLPGQNVVLAIELRRRHVLSVLIVFGDSVNVFVVLVKALISLVVVSGCVIHLAINRGVAITMSEYFVCRILVYLVFLLAIEFRRVLFDVGHQPR